LQDLDCDYAYEGKRVRPRRALFDPDKERTEHVEVQTARPHKRAKRLFVNHSGYRSRSGKGLH